MAEGLTNSLGTYFLQVQPVAERIRNLKSPSFGWCIFSFLKVTLKKFLELIPQLSL